MKGGVFSIRVTLLGLAGWIVPFVAAFVFFGEDGQLTIPQPLFKSIMIVVFGGFGAWLLFLAYKRVPPTMKSGLAIGLYWLGINWVLDFAISVPMMGTGITDYFYDIGLRYLLIPIMAVAMGAVAQKFSLDHG